MCNNCQARITTTSIKPLSYIRGIDNLGCKAWMPVDDLSEVIAPHIKVNQPITGNGTLLNPFDINFTSITTQDLKDLASTIPNGTLINFIGVNSSGEVVVDTLDPVTVVSTDSGNDLTTGTDGGAFFDLENPAVTEKIQDIIGVMLTSPLTYNDVLNTIGTSVSGVTVVSADSGNDLTTGADGGAYFDVDSPIITEKIQDAIGTALTSPLIYNDVLNTIGASVSSVTVVSTDAGNDLTTGADGGAYFNFTPQIVVSTDANNDLTSGTDGGVFLDLDSSGVTEKIQDAIGTALTSPLTYNDVLNTIGASISGVTVVSADAGNDISTGADGGAYFDLDSPASIEKIQDAVGNILTSPLVYNDLLNTITTSVSGGTVVSSDAGNDLTTGVDGGAYFDVDSPAITEKIQDAIGAALTSPLTYNDVLNTIGASVSGVTVVSADSGNDVSAGTDGGAYFDLDSVTSVEKIQDIIGATLVSPLVYNDTTNTISSTAITTVATGTGLQGDGVGNPISANLDTLPDYSGALVVGDKFVVSGGDGKLASSSQVANFITTDVVSAMPKGNLVAGTNVSFTGGTNRLVGSGDLTINVSGAAPTGTAGGDLAGTYPNPTIKANVALTGVPTVPTATLGTNTTQAASTAFVSNGLSNLITTTLGGDSSFATTNTSALATKAPLASPALTGIPTAPTATLGTNTTQIANTAFVAAAIANLIASSPAALDTLNELAAALGNDANFSTTITTALGLKAPLASPALTGTPTVPTATLGTNTTQAASTAFVAAGLANLITNTLGGDAAFATTNTTNLGLKANKDATGLSAGNLTSWKTALGLLALAFKNTIATADIDADAVTYAKLQNVSTNSRLLGRATSGSGDVEEITLGTNLSLSGTTLNATATGTSRLKSWAKFTASTGAILGSLNVTSVVRNSSCDYSVTLSSPMSNGHYLILTNHRSTSANQGTTFVDNGTAQTTTTFKILHRRYDNATIEPNEIWFGCYE